MGVEFEVAREGPDVVSPSAPANTPSSVEGVCTSQLSLFVQKRDGHKFTHLWLLTSPLEKSCHAQQQKGFELLHWVRSLPFFAPGPAATHFPRASGGFFEKGALV
jgi:hypothetical protein